MTDAARGPVSLAGAKIGVLVENKFIPEEISAYQTGFAILGAEVEFLSRIWYGKYKPKSATFYSDVDPLDNQPWESPHSLTVSRDISMAKARNYSAVIMSANYTSVRLRHSDRAVTKDLRKYVQSAPVVRWFAEAMKDRRVIKGALCHGLWILTPNPDLLKGRSVVCNPVMLADVLNCGARATLEPKVVVDGDLVTGYSKHEVVPFIQAIARQIATLAR